MCHLTQHSVVKFVKKAFGEKLVEAVIQRIDRLTQDEARITAPEILNVIHGLVQGMRVVMEGEQSHSGCESAVC
jgi:hypothetical protein